MNMQPVPCSKKMANAWNAMHILCSVQYAGIVYYSLLMNANAACRHFGKVDRGIFAPFSIFLFFTLITRPGRPVLLFFSFFLITRIHMTSRRLTNCELFSCVACFVRTAAGRAFDMFKNEFWHDNPMVYVATSLTTSQSLKPVDRVLP